MFISPAYAQASGGGDISSFLTSGLVPIVLVFAIMYFLVLRPQQQKQKQLREMIANLRRGDTVMTTGGLIGKIAKVDEAEVLVELAENVRVRVSRGMIAEVRAKGEPVKENA